MTAAPAAIALTGSRPTVLTPAERPGACGVPRQAGVATGAPRSIWRRGASVAGRPSGRVTPRRSQQQAPIRHAAVRPGGRAGPRTARKRADHAGSAAGPRARRAHRALVRGPEPGGRAGRRELLVAGGAAGALPRDR